MLSQRKNMTSSAADFALSGSPAFLAAQKADRAYRRSLAVVLIGIAVLSSVAIVVG